MNEKIINLENLNKEEKIKLNNKDNIIKELEDINEKLRSEITNLKKEQKIKTEEFFDFTNLINNDFKKEKLNELMKSKEKEINKMKSELQFELIKGEKLISLIFISVDESIHYSYICKNTDKFIKLEFLLYEIYPECKESDNFFIVNGNKINKYKTLEENKIKNGDIITLYKYNEN